MTVLRFPRKPVHKQRLYPKELGKNDLRLWDEFIEARERAMETPTDLNAIKMIRAWRAIKETVGK